MIRIVMAFKSLLKTLFRRKTFILGEFQFIMITLMMIIIIYSFSRQIDAII